VKHYAGIDVSLEASQICIVDENGAVVSEAKVASEPGSLAGHLARWRDTLERVGLEAGPLSQWLYAGLSAAGFAAVCLETRHLKGALSAQRVKSDRNDARGIAQVVRTGWYKAVHVKSRLSQERLALLTARRLLVGKLTDVENGVRGLLRNFGSKLGKVGRAGWEGRVRECLAGEPGLVGIIEPLLAVQAVLRKQLSRLDRHVLQAAREDAVCRRLMTVPGVGPVVSLTYVAAVDDPVRFKRSRAVGVHFGLTPKRYQSGEVDRSGAISKAGDEMARTALYEAATCLLGRVRRFSSLKAWGLRVAKQRGAQRARVALARKLAVMMHRMWCDGTEFRWSQAQAA
jgi:transposase